MFPTDATSFSQLFEGSQIWIYLGISIVNAVILFYCSMKFLLVLQQGGYYYRRYFKWLSNRDTPYKSRLMLLCLLGLLFFCVLAMTFSGVVGNTIASYVGFVAYILFAVAYINTESAVNAKVPLKKTKRLVRLCITYILFLTVITFGLLTLCNYLAFIIGDEIVSILRYCIICLVPFLLPYLLFIAYCLNEPFEWAVRTHYVNKARGILYNSEVLKIGITGSYGKTSVKEILKTILSQKFRVLATPESYNTPLGIAMTVNKLDNTHDIFIAEMGARSKGDIEMLAKLVKPKYGVLTGVNSQHLESFGTEEVIKNTKYELMENLSADGVAFFSCDNKISVELSNRFQGEKYLAGLKDENAFVTVKDLVTDSHGTSFTLVVGDQTAECSTILLGRHSISNICLAVSVAVKLGMTIDEIVQGINRIKSIEHRLELLPNNKNIVIIDDSYNANVDGVNASMEVLDMFEGRKIVLTPGLIELGKMENLVNFEYGKLLSKHADKVIVIGKHNAVMLINGLLEGGMDRENIKFAKSLNRGNDLLNDMVKEGDVVMFSNDLPDNYN